MREGLVDPDDASATVENLVTDGTLFRQGIAAFVAVFLIDVAVSWALYVLLRPGGPARSLVAAWFRLAHTVLLGVAATFLFLALQLAGGSLAAGLGASEREAWTALAIEAFDYTWLIGLAAFGVHLVLVGRLLASAMGARVLGALLAVAGAAYLFDTAAYTLLADYADHEDLFLAIVAIPSVVAELGFTIWHVHGVAGVGRRAHPSEQPHLHHNAASRRAPSHHPRSRGSTRAPAISRVLRTTRRRDGGRRPAPHDPGGPHEGDHPPPLRQHRRPRVRGTPGPGSGTTRCSSGSTLPASAATSGTS